MSQRLSGVITPILTPFGPDGRIARDLWVAHAAWVLAEGAHYLSPFGTTGEALSVGLAERREALEWLVETGIPADRLMPGTGVCALPETIDLTRHAMSLGCAGVMTLPAFFYPAAGEDGHMRYFERLIRAVDHPGLRICLYHIPSHAGVGISPSLAARLSQAFPGTVVAYKDSGGDWANTAAVIAAAPTLSVFPGSEAFLTTGLAQGAAGCISATCNLNARAIRRVFDGATGRVAMPAPDLAEADAEMKAFRAAVQASGLIGAMKAVIALRDDEPRWFALRPPLEDATRAEGEALLVSLGEGAAHLQPA